MSRHRVNRSRSAKRFKSRASKTHRINLRDPYRGGIRL